MNHWLRGTYAPANRPFSPRVMLVRTAGVARENRGTMHCLTWTYNSSRLLGLCLVAASFAQVMLLEKWTEAGVWSFVTSFYI